MTAPYDDLLRLLRRVRRRWRTLGALNAWAGAAVTIACVLAAARLADRLIPTQPAAVVVLWSVALAAALASLVWLLRRVLRRGGVNRRAVSVLPSFGLTGGRLP